MKYTRLYADSDGETHFENVDVEFNDGQIRSGGPTIGLSTPQPSSDCFFLETTGGSTPFLDYHPCLLYTSPSPRDRTRSRMPSSA